MQNMANDPVLSCFQPRMDQYFNQMEKIVKERKTSSRIRFMLQDIIDLRLVSVLLNVGPCLDYF